ncbi:hypothetical protein PF003_g21617 [Phytophthora fragariae]|nr:hypothetical protein PF003_g21617 [Phytophthora fragariae]
MPSDQALWGCCCACPSSSCYDSPRSHQKGRSSPGSHSGLWTLPSSTPPARQPTSRTRQPQCISA